MVVDKKPKDISELNDNKGFAIWIDKSILYDIEREIYEFLWFAHRDVKVSETEDGKLSVVNCKTTKDKKWIINKEIYELLFFARHDIKKAKTSDEKIEVINCNTKETNEWIIPEEYFK